MTGPNRTHHAEQVAGPHHEHPAPAAHSHDKRPVPVDRMARWHYERPVSAVGRVARSHYERFVLAVGFVEVGGR